MHFWFLIDSYPYLLLQLNFGEIEKLNYKMINLQKIIFHRPPQGAWPIHRVNSTNAFNIFLINYELSLEKILFSSGL